MARDNEPPPERREWTIERMASSGKYIVFWWQENELPEPRSDDYSTKWGEWNTAIERHDGLDVHIMNHGIKGVRVRLEKLSNGDWEIVEVGYPLGSFGPGTEWVVVVDSEFDKAVYGYDTEAAAMKAMEQYTWYEPRVYLAKVISKEQEHGKEEETKA